MMLTNYLPPWQQQPVIQPKEKSVIVIGGGIAGAATAYSLAECGFNVTVIERHRQLASEGSGNYQGILYMQLSPHLTTQTQLMLAGYHYTLSLLHQRLTKGEGWDPCGVINLDFSIKEQQRNALLAKQNYPLSLMKHVSQQNAIQLAGVPLSQSGLFFPQGGWVYPNLLIHSLLHQHPRITLRLSTDVHHLKYNNEEWSLYNDQFIARAPIVVLATAYATTQFNQVSHLPLVPIRGQTTTVAATTTSKKLKTVLSGEGYISPAWNHRHCFGATAIKQNQENDIKQSEHQQNFSAIKVLSNELYNTFTESSDFLNACHGHAAVRCATPDRLPLVGAVADEALFRQFYSHLAFDKKFRFKTDCPWLKGLYINVGHGSKGLITAPISGQIIASYITGAPMPLSQEIITTLNPNRFLVRSLARGN